MKKFFIIVISITCAFMFALVYAAPLRQGAKIYRTNIKDITTISGLVINQSSSKELVLSLDQYGPEKHNFPQTIKAGHAADYSATLPPVDEWSGSIFYQDATSFKGCYLQFRRNHFDDIDFGITPSAEGVKCSVSGTNLEISVSS
jgi:hypothetical protein